MLSVISSMSACEGGVGSSEVTLRMPLIAASDSAARDDEGDPTGAYPHSTSSPCWTTRNPPPPAESRTLPSHHTSNRSGEEHCCLTPSIQDKAAVSRSDGGSVRLQGEKWIYKPGAVTHGAGRGGRGARGVDCGRCSSAIRRQDFFSRRILGGGVMLVDTR